MSSDQPSAISQAFNVMQLPLGVCVLDQRGIVIASNPAAGKILKNRDELIGVCFPEYMPPELWSKIVDNVITTTDDFYRSVLDLRGDAGIIHTDSAIKPLRDDDLRLVGYLVCLRDITHEHATARQSESIRNMAEELTFDIGRILHANTSTLLMVNQTLAAAIETLDHDEWYVSLNQDTPPPHEAEIIEHIESLAARLANTVERLLDAGDKTRRADALGPEQWESLARQIDLLRDHQKIINLPELLAPALRKAAHEVAKLTRQIPHGILPRETLRDVLRDAESLERVICLADVARTRIAVIQMDIALRALRDFVTTEIRHEEDAATHPLDDILRDSIKQLAEFARVSNVELVWRDRDRELELCGNVRDLTRCLVDLLHNAIKYSWTRDKSKTPWVTIRTLGNDRLVTVEIESWGVPITEDEIRDGLIFKVGYRGKWSTDRGRLGTGIGLCDARRVAETHGGVLDVESRPARGDNMASDHRDYYRQPFITTVRLRLPTNVRAHEK